MTAGRSSPLPMGQGACSTHLLWLFSNALLHRAHGRGASGAAFRTPPDVMNRTSRG
ncbi:hypothetical protein HUT19_35020 [Streptomyces sp. NA02950]|uniref:hypothetical protein n=1 Tax=Streptomyces sp. NA02950 TaxID=2742137 RepID=UPI0015927CB9|nr:hypothetical protein [Streptomyces sp. NA02950]QKV96288.1 hypothetical protein HUT19_35020 [Streptomyces sp. NA02950]